MYTIYKITNSVNGKAYIGFDSHYPKRIGVHKSASKKGDTKFYRAVRKYGWENFTAEIIYQSSDRSHTLNEMEAHFILKYDTFKNGYNSTLGGDGCFGLMLSEESRKKISRGNKIKPKQTEEWIYKRITRGKKTREANKLLGKNYSPSSETRDKISAATKNKAKPFADEHKLSVSKHIKKHNSMQTICPVCGKSGQNANMKRWHFAHCKLNPTKT